ncbi:tetraspanin-3 [Folsomia candida]|nr:tetraspanin-3 [Folsomia candida]
MSLSGTKCTRLVLIFCNVIFSWISGGLLVLFGGASLYDPSYIQTFTLLSLDNVPQYMFILFALSIIALGGFIITLGLFGCFGTLCDNNCIIKTYVYLLIFVFVAEIGLAAGSLYIYFIFPSVATELKGSLVEKLKTDFGYPYELAFNTAVDFTQATLHCCGFNNYTDYDQSSWRSMALNNGLQVPYTCCSTTPISLSRWSMATNHTHPYDGDDDDHNLFREASSTESFYISSSTESSSWVKRCQSVNPMESDDYLYVNGCWDQVEQLYTRHALFTAILFASLALLQIVGVLFPICWLRRAEKSQQQVRIRTSRQAQPLL